VVAECVTMVAVQWLLVLLQRLLGLLQRLLGLLQKDATSVTKDAGSVAKAAGTVTKVARSVTKAACAGCKDCWSMLPANEMPSISSISCKRTSFSTCCWECLGQENAGLCSIRTHSCQPTKQAPLNGQKLIAASRGGGAEHG